MSVLRLGGGDLEMDSSFWVATILVFLPAAARAGAVTGDVRGPLKQRPFAPRPAGHLEWLLVRHVRSGPRLQHPVEERGDSIGAALRRLPAPEQSAEASDQLRAR